MSETAITPAAAPARRPWTRTFYWSLRRELWENRSIYIAPAAVAGVVLFGFIAGSHHVARTVQVAAATPAPTKEALHAHGQAMFGLAIPYIAAAAAPALTGAIVAIFYCLGALNGERRDRSILFWKSLPVSDTTAVLAKAFTAILLQPVVSLAIIIVAQAVVVAYSTAALLVGGVDPAGLWSNVDFPFLWGMPVYGLALNALWYVPIYGWLLLVSASAKRAPFLWAVAVPLGLALFEFVTFHTHYVWTLLGDRINGGNAQAFTMDGLGQAPIQHLSQIDPGRFFALPGLWGGLVFGAAAIAACIWLRRRHDPV